MPDETDDIGRSADQVRRALNEFLDRLALAVQANLVRNSPLSHQPDPTPLAPPGVRRPEGDRA